MEDLETFKKEFDKVLEKILDQKIAEFLKENSEKEFSDYLAHTKKIIMNAGKRIRPYLASGGWQMADGNGDKNEAMMLGVSLELFHAFALMHDDIIDKGTTRHGVPTLHVKINDLRHPEGARIKDYGESQALLIGDLLFSWSQELLLENVKKYYYKMVHDTVLGQMIDVSLTVKQVVTNDLIYQKMLLKTARYTFVYPLQMGAVLANADSSILDFYQKFGQALGVGFQIQDDILDVKRKTQNEKGKTTNEKTQFSDIASGQHTLLTNYIFKNGTKERKELLKTYFGKPIEEKDYQMLFDLFENSGAIRYGENESSQLFSQAVLLVENSNMEKSKKEFLLHLVAMIKERKN